MFELEKIRVVASDVPLYYLKETFPELNILFFRNEIQRQAREYIMRSLTGLTGKKKPKKIKNRPRDMRFKLAMEKFQPSVNLTKSKVESLRQQGLEPQEFIRAFKALAESHTQTFFDLFVAPIIDVRLNWMRGLLHDATDVDKFSQQVTDNLCEYLCMNQKDVPLEWILEQYGAQSLDAALTRFSRSFFEVMACDDAYEGIFRQKIYSVAERGYLIAGLMLGSRYSFADIRYMFRKADLKYHDTYSHELLEWAEKYAQNAETFLAGYNPGKNELFYEYMNLAMAQMDLYTQFDENGKLHVFYLYVVQGYSWKVDGFLPIKMKVYDFDVDELEALYHLDEPLFAEEERDRKGYVINPIEISEKEGEKAYRIKDGVPTAAEGLVLDEERFAAYLKKHFKYEANSLGEWDMGFQFKGAVRGITKAIEERFLANYDEILNSKGIYPSADSQNFFIPARYYRFHPHFSDVYRKLSHEAFSELAAEGYKDLQFVISASLSTPIDDIVKQYFPNVVTQITPSYDLDWAFFAGNAVVEDRDDEDETFSHYFDDENLGYRESIEALKEWAQFSVGMTNDDLYPYCLELYKRNIGASFFKLPVSIRRLVSVSDPFFYSYEWVVQTLSPSTADPHNFVKIMEVVTNTIANSNDLKIEFTGYYPDQEIIRGLHLRFKPHLRRKSGSVSGDLDLLDEDKSDKIASAAAPQPEVEKAETKVMPEVEPQPEVEKAEAKVTPESEPQPEVEKAETKATPEAEPQPKVEAKATPEAEPKPETKSESKTAKKSQGKAKSKVSVDHDFDDEEHIPLTEDDMMRRFSAMAASLTRKVGLGGRSNQLLSRMRTTSGFRSNNLSGFGDKKAKSKTFMGQKDDQKK